MIDAVPERKPRRGNRDEGKLPRNIFMVFYLDILI
jgi:hypothetical protein